MGVTRFALLSTAAINQAVLGGARDSDLVEIVAVGSRDRARAETYAREHGIERAHGSYEELLADPDVDAVYVALPNALHVEWSIRALEAGKHVLSEKPLSRDPAQVARAFDAAEAAGLLLMEGFMYRHHPQTRKLKELVDNGAIGELRVVRTHFSFALDRPGDVRWDPELGGGALLDLGCYCVSGSRLLAGEPEVVHAEQTLTSSGVDARFVATMRFAGGVLGHFDCALDLPYRTELEAVGSEATLFMPRPFVADDVDLELRRGDDVEQLPRASANRYQLELENLSRSIRSEEKPLLDRQESIAQARVLQALHRSATTGEPVRVA